MKKKMSVRLISLLLAVALVLSLQLTGCGNKKDPHNSEHTVSVLSTAIRTLSDSAVTDYKLINAIYFHAFSDFIMAETSLPENLAETLPVLFGNEPAEALVNATVAYGGTAIGNTKIGKSKPTKVFEQTQLYVGDLLFVNLDNTYAHYIYDKDGFVDLSAPLKEVDTAAVLASLPTSNQYAVLRLMRNMTNHDFVADQLPELEMTEEQQAVVAVAQSYLLRGDKLQYVSFTKGAVGKYYIGVNSPENHTSDNYGPIQCAGFCYDVYREAFGWDIQTGSTKLISTSSFFDYSKKLGIQKYLMFCDTAASYTEEQKEEITNEILELLEPGDILVVRRDGASHAMLYVGNENIIHADGASYNAETKTENYEATVRQRRFRDYFCTEGACGYLFGSDVGKRVEKFVVVRPLDIFDGEIPESTKNRMKNLRGIMAQKLSSHNISLTADVGEEITYTFELYNQNDEEVTLAVSDVIPEKSEYISGADKVDGDTLSWQVTIPANTRKKVSYVVKVAADAQKGDKIGSQSGLVGGVPVNCPPVTVNNTLSQDELAKLKSVIDQYQPKAGENGFAIVNDIYKQAFGWKTVFDHTDFNAVYDGKNGLYEKVLKGVNLRSDTKYSQMVAPALSGGYGTTEGRKGNPVVMPAKEQQFVVGDVLICKMSDTEQHLYLYAGDGVLYDLMNGFARDERTVQGRMEYFLRTTFGYSVLRPSLVH